MASNPHVMALAPVWFGPTGYTPWPFPPIGPGGVPGGWPGGFPGGWPGGFGASEAFDTGGGFWDVQPEREPLAERFVAPVWTVPSGYTPWPYPPFGPGRVPGGWPGGFPGGWPGGFGASDAFAAGGGFWDVQPEREPLVERFATPGWTMPSGYTPWPCPPVGPGGIPGGWPGGFPGGFPGGWPGGFGSSDAFAMAGGFWDVQPERERSLEPTELLRRRISSHAISTSVDNLLKVTREFVRALESGQITKCMAVVSKSYRDLDGRDAKALKSDLNELIKVTEGRRIIPIRASRIESSGNEILAMVDAAWEATIRRDDSEVSLSDLLTLEIIFHHDRDAEWKIGSIRTA